MSLSLSQISERLPGAYLATLGAFAGTLEALLNCMTGLTRCTIGPTERLLLQSNLLSADCAAATIALFKQHNLLLPGLTPEQSETLEEFMKTVETLGADIEKTAVELEAIKSQW